MIDLTALTLDELRAVISQASTELERRARDEAATEESLHD